MRVITADQVHAALRFPDFIDALQKSFAGSYTTLPRPGILDRLGAGMGGAGGKPIDIIGVGNDAGRSAGMGLRFQSQKIARVVGKVAFRNAVVDGSDEAVDEGNC